jgi:hypothetical protein
MKETLFKANGNKDFIIDICKHIGKKYEVKQTSEFLVNDLDDNVHCWFKVYEVKE